MKDYAFPHKMDGINSGMTLRDYFAGQVIVGHVNDGSPDKLAEYAYQIADAMLEARKE